MNDQVPVIVCTAGLAVNEKVDVVPLDDSEQGVARTPVVRSSVEGVQAGETPVPCKYRELAADSTTGTPADPQTSAPRASAIAPTTTHPIGRWGWNFEGGLGLISEVEEPAGERLSPSPTAARWPNSQRRSSWSRRRWWTSSVMRPVLGVRNHGPSSWLRSPFSAAQPWNGTSANDSTTAPSTP